MVLIAVVGSGRVGGEVAFVTVPAGVARSLEPDIRDLLTKQEKKAIKDAATAIYRTHSEAKGEIG
jgi:3-hydroxyacyl-CoA dehydrogenase